LRGAPSAQTRECAVVRRAHHPKSTTGRARRALPSLPLAVEKLPEARWAALPWAARRARASGQGAPS